MLAKCSCRKTSGVDMEASRHIVLIINIWDGIVQVLGNMNDLSRIGLCGRTQNVVFVFQLHLELMDQVVGKELWLLFGSGSCRRRRR